MHTRARPYLVPRAAIDALGAGAGGRGRGLPSISTLSLPVGNVPITKLVRASRKRTAKNQEWAESNTHKSKAKAARRWLAARALREANHFFSVLPFGGDARALAGVLHACYRFPLTPITRGVENWNLSWQL